MAATPPADTSGYDAWAPVEWVIDEAGKPSASAASPTSSGFWTEGPRRTRTHRVPDEREHLRTGARPTH